jgi:hypothetical protein
MPPPLLAAAAGAVVLGGLLGGNKAVTTQKIHNIISNHIGAEASAITRITCSQELEINVGYAKNCVITNEQECFAMANANVDTVINALQNAELDAELDQAIKGLSISRNTAETNNETRQETLNNLKATCMAEAEEKAYQRTTINIDVCDGTPIQKYQYGEAAADCVVKSIVDSAQESASSTVVEQDNKGLELPNSGQSFMMIVGAVVLIALMGLAKGGDGDGLEEGSQKIANKVIGAKSFKAKAKMLPFLKTR